MKHVYYMVFTAHGMKDSFLTDEYAIYEPITKIEHIRAFEDTWKRFNGYPITVISYQLLRTVAEYRNDMDLE